MAGDEGDVKEGNFEKDQLEPLIDLEISDSTELWLIQCPLKTDFDFNGQEVSLQLNQDGTLGNITGDSGKEYELISYKSLDADATVFVSSGTESKVVGKISRRVSFIHYPETSELAMFDPSKVKDEQDRALYERSAQYASSRSCISMSRGTFLPTQSSRSKQTNSSHGSKPRSGVLQASTPPKSSRKRQSSGSSGSKSSRVKSEQE